MFVSEQCDKHLALGQNLIFLKMYLKSLANMFLLFQALNLTKI